MKTHIWAIENRQLKIGNIVFLCSILLLLFPILVFPAEPTATPYYMDFYGMVEGGKQGDEITVYSSSGNLCGRFIIKKDGEYGFLHVYGDDPTTEVIEGAKRNEPLMFRLNGSPVKTDGHVVWTGDGMRRRLDIKK